MAGMEIPGLGRKLSLLVEHGYFPDRESLADAFGRARSTVYGWGHGGEGRASDTIPGDQVENLIKAVRACLSPEVTMDEARYLVYAPIAEFETRLLIQAETFLSDIICKEAVRGSGSLFPMPPVDAGLIDMEQESQEPAPNFSVPVGQWFRIEFSSAKRDGHVCALQHVGQSWGAVPCHFDRECGRVLLPGYKNGGELAHIREREETGRHQFIVLQTPKPPPIEFQRYLVDGIPLDGTIIRQLTYFYSNQPISRRKLLLLEVEIAARSHSNS